MDQVIICADSHKSNHIAVAIDTQGARLGDMTIPANRQGYCDLAAWATKFGSVKALGIEGAHPDRHAQRLAATEVGIIQETAV